MKHLTMFATLLGVLLSMNAANAQQHISLTNGNELYSHCLVAEKVYHPTGNSTEVKADGTFSEVQEASFCYAYIRGVVDSMPVDERFYPDASVRLSQYVDVVLAFLRGNAAQRDKPAASLVADALRSAFPKNKVGSGVR